MERQSKGKGVVDNSDVLTEYVTIGWSADSKKFRNPFFCNTVLSHWVFVSQCLDQWPSKIRPVHGLETLHNKHPIREHNIQEEQMSQLHHFGSPKTDTLRITIDKGTTYIELA